MNDLGAVKNIHLVGVAGTGMGAFAGLLKAAGYNVRGSDQGVYSPMKEMLEDWDIPVLMPYQAENLEPKPDLVVIGNVIRKDNIEAVATMKEQFPYCSFPEALGQLFLSNNKSIVVAGTHGKTTCCGLLAHSLAFNEIDLGFLIGGIPNNFTESFRCPKNEGAFFVVEGDEYDTAFFDKGPKFLHYQPKLLLCTSLEYDHADIYENVEQIIARFSQLISLLDSDGQLVLQMDSPHLHAALEQASFRGNLVTYGANGDFRAQSVVENQDGISFEVIRGAENLGRVALPISGDHNVQNALGCYVILSKAGLSHEQIANAYANFAGVKRRMEVKGQVGDILVIDDFAHHPTAVQTTIKGARQKFGNRPLWALFEPRSASSCRSVFQEPYANSFGFADRVLLAPTGRNLDPTISLDVKKLAEDITSKGVRAQSFDSLDAIVETLKKEVPKDAVLLCMSNGAFGDIHQRILEALK